VAGQCRTTVAWRADPFETFVHHGLIYTVIVDEEEADGLQRSINVRSDLEALFGSAVLEALFGSAVLEAPGTKGRYRSRGSHAYEGTTESSS